MEEMALEKVYPIKAPYGYIRNKDTGHLEIEPIEAEERFNLLMEDYKKNDKKLTEKNKELNGLERV